MSNWTGGDIVVYKEHYFFTHPECLRTNGGDGEYPAKSDGGCLCAKDAGYVDRCRAGEGFFDCRDCWNGRFEGNLQSVIPENLDVLRDI